MTQIIGWAIVHSLWQAGGLALLLAITLHLTRRATPVVRYRLAVVAMVGSLVIPVATVMMGDRSWHDAGRTVWLPGETGTAVLDSDAAPLPSAMESSAAIGMVADRERPGTMLAEARARVEALLPLIVAIWAGGLLVFTARLAGGLAGVRRLASAPDVTPLPPRLAAAASRLAARLRLRTPVPVRVSARVNVPVVVGYVRPLILLPVSLVTGLPPAQLEALIAHELAHVRRHDVLVNLVQRVIEIALFYHPAVWWISGRVRDERESCCDADAVRACRGDVASYASALLALEEMHDGRLITALAASHGPLLRRIERLVHGRAAGAELGARWVGGTLGLVAVLLVSDGAMGDSGAEPDSVSAPVAVATSGRDLPAPAIETIVERVRSPRIPAGRTLEQRWRRARREVAGGEPYWLAWSVAGSLDRRYRFHVDDSVSIRLDGDRLRGRVMLPDSIARRATIPGSSLVNVIGSHAPTDLVVLVGFNPARPAVVERLRVSSFELPAVLGSRRVVWLGRAGAGESIAQLQAIFADADRRHRRDLVAAIGMHPDVRQAVVALRDILGDRHESDAVREEAARWLAHRATPGSVAALVAAARAADDRDVREEAIEALAEHEHPWATDSLLVLAKSLEHGELRARAIEALGERGPVVVEPLVAMVNGAHDARLQAAAIEALAEVGDEAALRAVQEAARRHRDPRIRSRALRELARAVPTADAIAMLLVSLETDPDEEVRTDAVRAFRRVRPPTYAVEVLTELALKHGDREVRRSAVRTLGDMRRHDEAREALRSLAASSDDERVRAAARAELRDR